jgi:hypothetical protein
MAENVQETPQINNDNDTKSISDLKSKSIAAVGAKTTKASKKAKAKYANKVKIKKLKKEQFDLKLQIRETKITAPFLRNKIRNNPYIKDEDRDKLLTALDNRINKQIELYNKQIDELKIQQDIEENISEEDIRIAKLKTENLKVKFKEQLYEQKNKTRRKPSFSDIVEAIAFVTTIILENIAVGNTKIEKLVDDTNEIISNIETPADLASAKIKRNIAVSIIEQNERFLKNIEQIIQILNSLTLILSAVIDILSFFPFTLILNKILLRIQNLLIKISPLIQVSLILINKLRDDLTTQKNRLLALDRILENDLESIPNLISSADLNDNSTIPLGYLSGYDYKGFKFFIKVDKTQQINPPSQSEGERPQPIYPNYAVAVNLDGNEVLRSSNSYTLNPEVLIEELKLIIDREGLVA